MGAGSYPAGVGPAGADPVQSTRPVKPSLPTAMRYEGKDSDWALLTLDDGSTRYRSVHPVDQGVALSLCIAVESIKSSPTTGGRLVKIRYLNASTLGTEITRAVYEAQPLARYLADGSVTIKRITYETQSHGRLLVAVDYRNNVLRTDERAIYES